MARRAFDLLGALVIGLLTAPIWLCAAIVIRVIDGAPVMHRASRVGRGGASFILYKFRTMDLATGPALTAHGDPRVTRLGALLRRTRIDELPQLWNVIRGDMSLVGPRPEDPRYVARYSSEQRRLLSVAPGLTSPATIAYRDEEVILAGYPDPERAYMENVLPAKLALDLEWLERRSMLGDLRLVVATVRVVVGKDRRTDRRGVGRVPDVVTGRLGDRARAVALGRAVLPVADRVLGQRMTARFRLLDRAQWWPRERVIAARDRALAAVVRAAGTEVELYRELYAGAGVDPGAVVGAADLVRLPIVSKDDLRDGFPERTTRPTSQKTYDECSAGSTGEPLCVKEDAATAGWYRATFLQILSWAGWSMGQRHVQLGINPDRQRGRALKDRLLRCSYLSMYDLDDDAMGRVLGRIQERRIRYVFGYPMGIYEIARRSLLHGPRVRLDGAVAWGDALGHRERTTIEEAFECRVLDAYGLAEGVWIASQCPTGGTYHVHSLDVILELLDDEGRAVAPGTPGHVVVTRLYAGPSPLIRYRTGDLAVGTTASCTCGRGYESISSIVGRTADTVVTPSGKRLLVHFFNGMFDHRPDIAAFQAAKTHADRLELRIVPRNDGGIASADDVAVRIRAEIPDMRVDVRVVERVPLTRAGKRRFVIDETAKRSP